MPYLMRFCVPHENEFHNNWRNFVCGIYNTTWNFSLEILNVFHFLFFDFPSIPHLATLSHLCGICICNANCTYWQYESVGRKNWDIQLYFPLLYYVTQTPQLLLMFGHFCFYVEIRTHFSVNREDRLGRRMICPPNLNVLCNISKFSVNHYHWANYRIWEFTTVWMCVPFATPKKSSVFPQCLQFCRGL